MFLATKTRERSGDAARAELELSLERLGVEQIDLIQLHNLVEPDEWQQAHGPGGAVQAMAQARAEGLVRWIGVTGHGTRIASMHLRSLQEFAFDSVLLPWSTTSLANPSYRDDVERLLERCRADNVAVQTIKAIAKGRWPGDYEGPRFSWYEPLEDGGAISRAVRSVLAQPQLFLNTTSDARKLDAIFEAARSSQAPPTAEELAADVASFGMAPLFDGQALERI